MSAKENDLLRIQEMYDIATQTMSQIDELEFNRKRFVHAQTVQDRLITGSRAFHPPLFPILSIH